MESPSRELVRIAGELTAARKYDKKFFKKLIGLEPKGGVLAYGGPKSKLKSKYKGKERRSFEFPSKDALDKYLKEHPAADKRKHTVKESEKTSPAESIAGKFGNREKHDSMDVNGAQDLVAELGSFGGESRHVANYGIWVLVEENPEKENPLLTVMRGEDGNPSGVAFTWEHPNGDLEIDALSSNGKVKGMGTFLIAQTIRESLKKGKSLKLSALRDSDGFYEHIGMKQGEENIYRGHDWSLSYKDAKAFSDGVYNLLSSGEEAEPKVEPSAPEVKEMLEFKKSGFGRKKNPKAEFIKNMDASNYESAEAFASAKKRIQEMSSAEFSAVLAGLDEDEEMEKAAHELPSMRGKMNRTRLASELVRMARSLVGEKSIKDEWQRVFPSGKVVGEKDDSFLAVSKEGGEPKVYNKAKALSTLDRFPDGHGEGKGAEHVLSNLEHEQAPPKPKKSPGGGWFEELTKPMKNNYCKEHPSSRLCKTASSDVARELLTVAKLFVSERQADMSWDECIAEAKKTGKRSPEKFCGWLKYHGPNAK